MHRKNINSFIKNFVQKENINNQVKLNIDYLLPGYISGWISLKNKKFEKIFLSVGDLIISSTEINIDREDVKKEFNLKSSKLGFLLKLPNELSEIIDNPSFTLYGLVSETKKVINLNSFVGKNFFEKLKSIVSNDQLGTIGHIDGIQSDHHIHGWAGKRNSFKKTKIYMQCDGFNSKEITCNLKRDQLESMKMHPYCGFRINLNTLPIEWNNKKIFFTFDEKGELIIPSNEEIVLSLGKDKNPNKLNYEDLSNTMIAQSEYFFIDQFSDSNNKTKIYLKEYEEFLNELEKELY